MKKKQKLSFKVLKQLMKMKYKRPAFMYLGEEVSNGAIILSNHEGTDAPMSLEIYFDKPVRMWGAYQMNSGLKKMYKYQTRVYYHEKKHWNLHLARLFCLIASPLTNLFYSGFDLISTYQDTRFLKTLRESEDTIHNGGNVVVFPEVSDNGYLAELEGFHAGCVMLAERLYKKGIDVPIFVSYFKKQERVYVIDKPIKYSQLIKNGKSREEIAEALKTRCNELGKMTFDAADMEQLKLKQAEKFKEYKKQQKLAKKNNKKLAKQQKSKKSISKAENI